MTVKVRVLDIRIFAIQSVMIQRCRIFDLRTRSRLLRLEKYGANDWTLWNLALHLFSVLKEHHENSRQTSRLKKRVHVKKNSNPQGETGRGTFTNIPSARFFEHWCRGTVVTLVVYSSVKIHVQSATIPRRRTYDFRGDFDDGRDQIPSVGALGSNPFGRTGRGLLL